MPIDSVQFHRLATKDYRVARNWYRHRNAAVALRFRDAVDSAVNRVAADPDSHPLLEDDIRWVRVRKFPYILVFVRQNADSLLVLAVAHAKRRPGYWKRRR